MLVNNIIITEKDEYAMEENNQNNREIQNEVQSKKQSASKKSLNGVWGGLLMTAIFGIITWKIKSIGDNIIAQIFFWFFFILTLLCLLVFISCLADWKEAINKERIDEKARLEEQELMAIDPSKRALRAEKMYKYNQNELMRYYDLNIGQMKFLSFLGIFMIIAGIVILAISIWHYINSDAEVIFFIAGNISGVLVDFLGAIFIKMYTENIKAAVEFHSKFAESNNLLLSNLVAHNINDDKLREETLSKISQEIILKRDTDI